VIGPGWLLPIMRCAQPTRGARPCVPRARCRRGAQPRDSRVLRHRRSGHPEGPCQPRPQDGAHGRSQPPHRQHPSRAIRQPKRSN